MSTVAFDNALDNFVYLPDDTPNSFITRFHQLYVGKPELSNDTAKLRDLRRVIPKPMKDIAAQLWSTFKSFKDAQDWVIDNLVNFVRPGTVNAIGHAKPREPDSEQATQRQVQRQMLQLWRSRSHGQCMQEAQESQAQA
eukprot:TRINITY_DN3066_c0_g1_i3.p4 TRINITY_DN3066_c0_g1~~TRINITY_DN3066_c0_g1_i3.p4  ORF type:complete len:139 (+),score=38.04 TRINITY_DN3066_c0_g1_i3:522-938(+)